MTDRHLSELRWQDALTTIRLLTEFRHYLGGVVVYASPGPVRDAWLAMLSSNRRSSYPLKKVPATVSEARLVGGMDLGATLAAGRPIAERGLLAECDQGIVILAMAERASTRTVAHLCSALDQQRVFVARESVDACFDSHITVVALNEACDDDDGLSAALSDRLGLHISLDGLSIRDIEDLSSDPFDRPVPDQRSIVVSDEQVEQLCACAALFGVDSLRAPMLATRVAQCLAALDRRDTVSQADIETALRLVIAPRATRLPPQVSDPDDNELPQQPEPEDRPKESASTDDNEQPELGPELADQLVEAAAALLPAGLLERLKVQRERRRNQTGRGGVKGAHRRSRSRGRPLGAVAGELTSGVSLDLSATLRTAAPWQGLRERGAENARVQIRKDDIRIKRFSEPSETTIIFVVDASGSQAMHRLGEAKGAIELLLADCYARRDHVALIMFRGQRAELLLPPTRSLVRAKRNLTALPGGGGTPLVSAIDMAEREAHNVSRRGGTPSLVFLTDGRANIRRDGSQGRNEAFDEALIAARAIRASGVNALIVDTSVRPNENARRLAKEMAALYLPLPRADSRTLQRAVTTFN